MSVWNTYSHAWQVNEAVGSWVEEQPTKAEKPAKI